MNFLIGSRALNYWLDEGSKPETDWDVISSAPLEGTEHHDLLFLNNEAVCKRYCTNHTLVTPSGDEVFMISMEGLAIIKRSHLWRNLSFGKHITHYHWKSLASHFVNNDLYKQRLALSYDAFEQWKPDLNKSVEDFFDDAVTKIYNHDWLHEVVAYYDKPLYTRLQKDSSKAWCSEDLWYNLTYEDRVRCVVEETKVIAIERFLVPRGWTTNSKLAYMKALEKVCTTLCSGWFRDFAINNFPVLLNEYNQEDFKKYKGRIISSPNIMV